MGIDFTVFKGSDSGAIVESKGHRDVGPTEALVELSHCGVCGTDEHYRHVNMGLGHEGVGIIKELGPEASRISDLKVGDRVAMGWMRKICLHCEPCLTGQQSACQNSIQFGTGGLDQGCFGTAVAWDVSTLIKVPDEIASEDAGPLACGGATVWGPLYQHGLRPGDRIGVLGIGGLGHLAIQFASKMGMEAVVFSGTSSKRDEAMAFGGSEFVATQGVKKFEGIKPLDALLITTSILPDFSLYIPILKPFAKIFPLTISFDAASIPMLPLVVKELSLVGSAGAHFYSMKAMMDFVAKHGIRPQIEKFPMTQKGVTDAMQKLKDGKMRYRGVVVVEGAK